MRATLLPLILLAPLTCYAQGVATPTPEQDAFMLKGKKAYQAKDYKKAAEMYAAASDISPINIALLNEGRALQRAGDCEGAARAYLRVPKAPTLKSLAADTVRGAMERYLDELHSGCDGRIHVTCDPGDMALTLADAEAGLLDEKASSALPPIRCGEPVALSPGLYRVTGAAYERERVVTVKVIGTQTHKISLFIDPNPDPEVIVKEGNFNYLRLGGWSAVALGVGGLASGVIFGTLLEQNNEDVRALDLRSKITRDEIDELQSQGDRYQTMQFLGYGVALAGLSTGAVLLYLDLQREKKKEASAGPVAVTPWLSPRASGAALRWGF